MIKNISIEQYRKLKNIEFEFNKGINILSGSNGTCKTSILHIVSNSFQTINKKIENIRDNNCIDIIKGINDIINPKIESLTKGDKEYNDPAKGCSGTLYSVSYTNGKKINFRRHNSQLLNGKNRFSIKPSYRKGNSESLIKLPIIYLGLSRLYAHGEYQNEDNIKYINKKLPQVYLDEIASVYKDFTGIDILYKKQQKLGDIKTRAEFATEKDGIDSNTISAGEDNLFIIITALVSLKYYYESIQSSQEVESILLIDEFDATLHPSYQVKLLNILKRFCDKYKIQVIFTTHSLFLLEEALKNKHNVIYLIDNIDDVKKMKDVDIYKIKMHLENRTISELNTERCIPIFTEDNEARLFLKCMFDSFEKNSEVSFSKIKDLFYIVDANISSEALCNIFESSPILRSTIRSICVLDGDKSVSAEYNNHIITLPGGKSPEKLFFEYANHLYETNSVFWNNNCVADKGYTKVHYRDKISKDIESINIKINETKKQGKSTKGIRREENKKLFREYEEFFILVINHWILDPNNEVHIRKFYNDLKIMFKKVSKFHDISAREWGA
ncbi:AAA family ATPase [Clostridioides difficile]